MNSRKVTLMKQNAATKGLQVGLKFRESFGKAVYVDKIIPGTQAAKLASMGKINVGDEVVMVSATFGDEMWSCRGSGKARLEKSISVRQGMSVSLVLESKNSEASRKQEAARAKKEAQRISRLQDQLTREVEAEKSKGPFSFW